MILRWCVSAAVVLAGAVTPVGAQTFDTVGTRAAGMGGAFVAVADDASAAYWNPAGFASGAYFSLVLDGSEAKLDPPGSAPGGSRSGLLLALGTPAVGLSYYRLRSTAVRASPLSSAATVEADTLITHHVGATVVQSLAPGLAAGATLKLVRGFASSVVRPADEREALLEDGGNGNGQGSTRFDADLGVMATAGRLKAGLTLRNATEPSFKTSGGTSMTLERQARAGIAVTPIAGWVVAADLDVLESDGPAGRARRFAAGAEGRIYRRALIRGGFSANTSGDSASTVSAGASFAVTGSLLIDAQVTGGSDHASTGWGISARIAY
jgi:hypothetical protein